MSVARTLSRARLRIARGGGKWERRSTLPYLIHQAVADLFGDRDDRGYLYRVTRQEAGHLEVLILSDTPPLAIERVSSPPHRRAVQVESKPFQPDVGAGQFVDFEIRLNATQVVTDPATGRKRRTDVWEAVWQADPDTRHSPNQVYGEYLARKLDGAADVLDTCITERGETQAARGGRKNVARFVAANAIGTLRVVDPARFLEVVGTGIGRAKSFGCGLLCLSRPGTMLARAYPEVVAELR